MYAGGATQQAIADKYGVHQVTVRNTLRRWGVPLRSSLRARSPERDARDAAVIADYRAGMKGRDIAEKHGLPSATSLYPILARHGEPRRHNPAGGAAVPLGTRRVDADGYVVVKVGRTWPFWPPDFAGSAGGRGAWVREHRMVMAEFLGRPLDSREQVHHVNGDRQDNRLENLQLRSGPHGSGVAYVCSDCGSARLAPVEL